MTVLLAAMGTERRWRSKVRDFVREKQQPMAWKEPPKAPTLHDRIVQQLDVDEVTAWMMAIDEEGVGLEYADIIQRARAYLKDKWPAVATPGLATDSWPLAPDELDEVWSICRVLDDPDVLFEELQSWTVTVAQVAAMRAIYPELSTMLDDILLDEIAEYMGDSAKLRQLPWQKEDIFRVWRGIPLDAPIEIQLPQQQEQQQPTKHDIKFDSLLTRDQRISAK
jgi:hypothetical protein